MVQSCDGLQCFMLHHFKLILYNFYFGTKHKRTKKPQSLEVQLNYIILLFFKQEDTS